MNETDNEQNKPSKLKGFVGKFDFLSVVAGILIAISVLSLLIKKINMKFSVIIGIFLITLSYGRQQ